MTTTYRPIDGWDIDACRQLIKAHEDEIFCLLWKSFSLLVDDHGYDLGRFGFHDDEPVSQAVTWCMDRFVSVPIDPGRLHPGSRSFRLFTEPAFWLSQKVGLVAWRRITAESARERASSLDSGAARSSVTDGADHASLDLNDLARALRDLRARTCPTLVTLWLDASVRLREALFAEASWDRSRVESPALSPGWSPKTRSLYTADALFRYLVILLKLGAHDSSVSMRACWASWFSPCEDEAPFEVRFDEIRHSFDDLSSRRFSALRLDGVTTLLRQAVSAALDDDAPPLRAMVARTSLRESIRHRFHIDDARLREDLARIKDLLK